MPLPCTTVGVGVPGWSADDVSRVDDPVEEVIAVGAGWLIGVVVGKVVSEPVRRYCSPRGCRTVSRRAVALARWCCGLGANHV